MDWLGRYWGKPYVGLIHRLDRNTSGLLLAAKTAAVARKLTEDLQEKKVRRLYLGWVIGVLDEKRYWNHYLIKDRATNRTRVVDEDYPKAEEAALWAEPVKKGKYQGHDLTLVSFELDTGRSHQIRAQAAKEGFPLLGDAKYAGDGLGFHRPALHSAQIRFTHPVSNEPMAFKIPLPPDLTL